MKTSRGIYLNIEESTYFLNFEGVTFYFSSMFYKEKFKRELKKYIDIESIRLYNRLNLKNEMSIFLAISLYKKIEKRGFRVLIHNKEQLEENHIFKTIL